METVSVLYNIAIKLESKSESVSESVSGNVNKPLHLKVTGNIITVEIWPPYGGMITHFWLLGEK